MTKLQKIIKRQRDRIGKDSNKCFLGTKKESQFDLGEYFNIRIAIIQLKTGETKEDAWSRHLSEHPEDSIATIKIFNQTNIISHSLRT
jgi:hypothetical protein